MSFKCKIASLLLFLHPIITSVWPNNAHRFWLSTPIIACLCYYRIKSEKEETIAHGCLAAMFFFSKMASQPWLSGTSAATVVAGREKDTDDSYYSGLLECKLPPRPGETENQCSIKTLRMSSFQFGVWGANQCQETGREMWKTAKGKKERRERGGIYSSWSQHNSSY